MTIDIDTITLASGAHNPNDTEMCVMEAASLLAGEKWSDHPQCASPVIAAFLRSWNDTLPDTDRQALKRYIVPLVGSKGTPAQESARSWMACDWLVRTFTPAWLRLAGLTDDADALEALPELTTAELVEAALPIIDKARKASAAAGAAAWAAAGDAAGAAAWAAAMEKLAPTRRELQKSAGELLTRMIEAQ